MKAVGARLPRYDGVAHVTGQTQYVDDIRVRGTLWTKALRSPHPNAAIKNLDTQVTQTGLVVADIRAITRPLAAWESESSEKTSSPPAMPTSSLTQRMPLIIGSSHSSK